MVSLETLTFWKRKDFTHPSENQRIIPLPPLPSKDPPISSMSEEEVAKAKGALKVLLLEKQILGSAITTIFESESKGIISENERDHLVEKYKVDLTRLEKTIGEKQKIVDLHDLENTRRQLINDYKFKMAEIETKIENLMSGKRANDAPPTRIHVPTQPQIATIPRITETSTVDPPSRHVEAEVTDAEKRIEQIRTEILQAMDRLEQIETEG